MHAAIVRGLIVGALLVSCVSIVRAQQKPAPAAPAAPAGRVETDVTHRSHDYPSGPPYSGVLSADAYPFRDLRNELRNKTTGTYTVTSTGDLFWRFPVAKRIPADIRDLLRNADTTVGNLEGGSSDYPPDRGRDVADLGFDLLAPGEDDSVAGYEARAKYLFPLGVKVPGMGMNLAEARRPVFQETPQGLVAFLHACPGIDLCGDAATATTPGVNPLGLTVWNTVTATQLAQLQGIRDSIMARRNEPDVVVPSAMPPAEPPGRLTLFGQRYMVADKPGDIHYEVNKADEQAQILAVRNAKEISDFVIFHMHAHQNRHSFQHYSMDNYPSDYMRPFLHKLIDNGLDMYVGTGVHTLQGIEIYKGRPIFYNQGNLGRDLIRRSANAATRDNTMSDNSAGALGGMTPTERGERVYYTVSWNEISSTAYIAHTTYKDGRLSEIRLYPVEIGLGQRPWSREHIPQTPSPEKARQILERVQKYSEPFGTRISIENNIGIIRVPPEATVDVGGDLVIPGRGPK